MRLLHKFYAWFMGYFWLPCPVCGKEFGGHEIKSVWTGALIKDGHGWACCPDPQCSYEAGVRNMANGHSQTVRA